MNRSRDQDDSLLPDAGALQHEHAPRPLPLFLELVRLTAERDPALACAALDGLSAYANAERPEPAGPPPEVSSVGPAVLRDHGGGGPPAVLVPSLINPPHILDLDPEVSLTAAITGMGRRVLLLDWGKA
jgi:polyhydroxyalkanoate synthase subunit PhaC